MSFIKISYFPFINLEPIILNRKRIIELVFPTLQKSIIDEVGCYFIPKQYYFIYQDSGKNGEFLMENIIFLYLLASSSSLKRSFGRLPHIKKFIMAIFIGLIISTVKKFGYFLIRD